MAATQIEQNLMSMAEDADARLLAPYSEMMPEADLNPKLIRDLYTIANQLIALMKGTPLYVSDEWTPELSKALSGLAKAGEDFGAESLSILPDSDTQLRLLIAALTNLAKSKEFQMFLKAPRVEEEPLPETKPVMPIDRKGMMLNKLMGR